MLQHELTSKRVHMAHFLSFGVFYLITLILTIHPAGCIAPFVDSSYEQDRPVGSLHVIWAVLAVSHQLQVSTLLPCSYLTSISAQPHS